MDRTEDPLSAYREEILKCTNCGFCQTACPIFGVTLRTAYNTRGKMLLLKELMEGMVSPSHDLAMTFYVCTTCRTCTYSCPRNIKAAEIVEGVRRELYRDGFVPGELTTLKENILKTGNCFSGPQEDRIEVYPPKLKERVKRGETKDEAETLIFFGCLPSYTDMKIVPSLVKVLDAADADYTTLALDELCCGLSLYLMGAEEFPSHAEKLIQRIRATGVRNLVTPCSGCYKAFKDLYPLYGDLGVEVYHTVHYLEGLLETQKLKLPKEINKRVTYHDPCDLGRAHGIFDAPRRILNRIEAIDLVEMAKNRLDARCCGGGGNLLAYRPGLARQMAAERVQDALAVEADLIVTCCPACKDNLRKGALSIPRQKRKKIQVMDITEMVADALG